MSPRVRSAVLLGIVGLMLLAAYFLQKLEERGDDPVDEVPSSELTPRSNATTRGPGTASPTDIAVVADAIRTLSAATQRPSVASTPQTKRELTLDEFAGGHTISRHVGKTDAELRQRLRAEPDISAASTYTDLQTAERVVAEVLAKKRAEIETWEAREGSRPNLVLRLDIRETIGRSMKQGRTSAIDVEDALVVLRWTGNGWFVLTSYPEDR
jgi:hypothetical protein